MVEGTSQHRFWRSYASVLAYTYDRLCSFVDEFFCATVNESLDQWKEEYGLNDECDPYGNNLCIKVAAQGGVTCDYFVEMARLSGYVIECEDTSQMPEPIAGCFEVGCTPMGPTPTFNPRGSTLGYGVQGVCVYGEVVDHPDPEKWENGKTKDAYCPVPGSNLGFGPDEDESCCFIVGYYDLSVAKVDPISTYCQDRSHTIFFDCPANNMTANAAPCPVPPTVDVFDSTGNYTEWGQAFTWQVTVDLAASTAAQIEAQPTPDPDMPISAAGNFMVGTALFSTDNQPSGTPLCFDNPVGATPTFILCFLERIKPAHTTLNVRVI